MLVKTNDQMDVFDFLKNVNAIFNKYERERINEYNFQVNAFTDIFKNSKGTIF